MTIDDITSPGIIKGSVGGLILPLKRKQWTGTLYLERDGINGLLRFKDGEVVEALKNGVHEEFTLMELIRWDTGTFRLEGPKSMSDSDTEASEGDSAKNSDDPGQRKSAESLSEEKVSDGNVSSNIDLICQLEGVVGVVVVDSDGARLVSRNLGEEKSDLCKVGTAYWGSAADSISQAWDIGPFLHGAITGTECKLLLHPDGDDFIGTSIHKTSSAAHIGPGIERILTERTSKR